MKRPAHHDVFPERRAAVGVAGIAPMGFAPIVAHQGGWDEILLVVAPLAIVGGLLWLANRRVTAQLENELGADGAIEATETDVDQGSRHSGDDGQD